VDRKVGFELQKAAGLLSADSVMGYCGTERLMSEDLY
jgi:hypothetical protein